MFANRPQSRRPYPPSSRSQVSPALNDVWRLIWPFTTTTILGICLILCVLVIGALETASLAISTDQIYYGNTSSTGAGFWCEFYVFIAATLILIINFVLHTRLWATMALLGTFTAAGFSIVIIGLDARAVRDANDRFGMLPKKVEVLAAQLAFACLELVLCGVFIGIYILVHIYVQFRFRRLQNNQVPLKF
ncbi:unnamed protein product [Rotaria magnacalcarata]|uniref:Uncharacterized protein n=2 Tax=Rotaria magnacalcarata TaxID=392030 RepID=A0A816RCZ7_9BILA|nr:unnamed protein product [Rotaria magnacalcarata]CAF2135988.1 unnamed protein product [Rotaria magnacalcarata]CAF5077972.1 unnamed protein product [Rotaria magnacalcarata]